MIIFFSEKILGSMRNLVVCYFLIFFKFCEQQNILVDQVKNEPQTVYFTRWLRDTLLKDWQMILSDMENLNFSSGEVLVSWKFGSHGRFSVK